MTRALPREAERAMWTLRGGLAVAAVGIIGFFLSFGQVGAARLASADYHPMPTGAIAAVGAWGAGMLIAAGSGAYVRMLARRAAGRLARDERDV